MSMERAEQRRIVEALVLASPEPISPARLAEIVPECTPAVVRELVAELGEEYASQDRAFEIWEVAGGYQLRTRAEFSGYLQQLQKLRPLRLSRAALETLSIVAYKQPATRAEVEDVRGVDAGAVLKSLLERDLVRIAGHREVPGRPMLYATTRRFLEVFGLESLKQLPPLRELEELAREAAAPAAREDATQAGGQGEDGAEAGSAGDRADAASGDGPAEAVAPAATGEDGSGDAGEPGEEAAASDEDPSRRPGSSPDS